MPSLRCPLSAQACSAIATYIGALKHRGEDLASIGRHAQALESVFQALSQSLTEDSSDPLTSSAAALVSSSMQTCEAELNSLKQLMARFSDSLPPNARPQDKILQQATKLKYPLRKPDISRMQESLRVIEETLLLALQNLGLRYSQLAISKLDDVEEASAQASTSLDALRSEVSTLKDIVSSLQEQIPTVQHAIESIPPLIISKADLQLVQTQEFHRQTTVEEGTTVYRLVSKPSNLASLCGSLDNLYERATPAINALQRAPAVYASSCCRYFRSNGDERSRRLGLKLAGFLKNAIIITFYMNTGAGGHSIGANIDFYATVDRRTSPAFRVMRVLGACAPTQKLENLFREGKSGAKDVDSSNQSLLHAAAELSGALEHTGIAAGFARTALKIALWSKHSSTSLAAAFYPEEASIDTEEFGSWTSSLVKGQWLARSLDLFASIPRVAQVYHELKVAAKFTTCLKEYGSALQWEHYHAAIRFTTFKALGIAHTCLGRYPGAKELEAAEIAEIQYEDAELLEILELLVEEFEEHAFKVIDAAADVADSMITFWNGYWVDRMHQVLSELSRADDEGKLAAQDLGVSWTGEPDEEVSRTPVWKGWDYYFRQIEEIE
ncbi:hypothetical protein TgHK011_001321 [Trichoderma gracile]|nr:hypothetical protein TgHK011_001321 [Trichoderma gracile]